MRLGVDLTSIKRIQKLVDRFAHKALKRFLTPNEIALYAHNPQKIASAWVAKEAFSKALGSGIGKDCSFLDIELLHNHQGSPFLTINPRIIHDFKIATHTISITHDEGLVIAVVAILFHYPQSIT